MKLRNKISLYFSGIVLLLTVPLIVFYTKRQIELTKETIVLQSNAFNIRSANLIEEYFHGNIEKARHLAHLFSSLNSLEEPLHREIITGVEKQILSSDQQIAACWYNRQLYTIDKNWKNEYGRLEIKHYRAFDNLIYKETLADTINEGTEYKQIRLKNNEVIYPPYWGSYTGLKEHEKMYINVAVPLQNNNQFAGLAGLDFDLDQIADYLDKINPFEDGFSILIHSGGSIVYHPNSNLRTKHFSSFFNEKNTLEGFKNNFENSQDFSGEFTDNNQLKYYCNFTTIKPVKSNDFLYFGSFVPYKVITQESKKILIGTIIIGLLGLMFVLLLVSFIGKQITSPMLSITNLLKALSQGRINSSLKVYVKSNDELEEMTNSANILIDSLEKTTNFAKEIGKGNLSANFTILGEQDTLGKELLNMRNSLMEAQKEQEIRKTEDEKQKWAANGLALFSEIQRNHNTDLTKLSYALICELVKYTDSIQGAIFVLNEDDYDSPTYELKAAIAYNRQKNINSTIGIGEGLVGRCAYEKLPIYIEDVPDNYVHITSGLGEANPTSILLSPALVDNKVMAVLELISFDKFPKFKSDFIWKVGESIAATIVNVKNNQKTNQLLEQAMKQSDELAAQEEELRQNLEELQATQEELVRLQKLNQNQQ